MYDESGAGMNDLSATSIHIDIVLYIISLMSNFSIHEFAQHIAIAPIIVLYCLI